MRTVVRKVFAIWNFDKEEKWLNEMAARGLGLVSVGFCRYEFEDCNPGEYEISLEMLDRWHKSPASRKYVEFVEETGAENIGCFGRWVYFRKKRADGSFTLFSDNTTRIRHLKGILWVIGIVSWANFCAVAYNLFLYWQWRLKINLMAGCLSTIVFGVCIFGFTRIFLKRKKLKEEQRLFE